MKKLIIATALFVSAGVCVSAGLLPSNTTDVKAAPVAAVEPGISVNMKDLGTAD